MKSLILLAFMIWATSEAFSCDNIKDQVRSVEDEISYLQKQKADLNDEHRQCLKEEEERRKEQEAVEEEFRNQD